MQKITNKATEGITDIIVVNEISIFLSIYLSLYVPAVRRRAPSLRRYTGRVR